MLLIVIDNAAIAREPATATKTLGDILGHEHIVAQPY
jgi:hypothetical protein